MDSVLTPRQARSQRTQERLLVALEDLLQVRFFEHITIQDIAEEAGVAVGTIYRRFRNKEAFLPVLYRRLDDRLAAWAEDVWRGWPGASGGGLRDALRRLVAAHVRFYRANAPLLRTLYLQVRLDGELAAPDLGPRRRALYETLLEPVWSAIGDSGHPAPSPSRVRCFVLLLLTPVNERCLFPDNTPASTVTLSDRRFVTELSGALYAYLTSERF